MAEYVFRLVSARGDRTRDAMRGLCADSRTAGTGRRRAVVEYISEKSPQWFSSSRARRPTSRSITWWSV